MPVYLPETESDIIKRNGNGRNDKLIHAMRKQQQHQQQLINSNTVGHFGRSHYHSHSQSRHHYRTSNQPQTQQQQMPGGNSSHVPQFHISIPQLNLEVQPMHHPHHPSLQQPTTATATLTAYSPSSATSPSSNHPMMRHLSSSSSSSSASLNHLHNNHNHNHTNKAVSRITTTTTTTTTTVASRLMDSHDKHNLNTLIGPDAYLQQSETQPAMLQMNEFDDDDITPREIVEPSVHSIVDGNTNNAMLLKPTIVNTTTTTTTTINNNSNNNDSNHVRRQPTSKTWISPFPSRRENLYFFMFSYKVMACPYRRNCPEKVICELFHHDGEKRRHPGAGPKFLYLEEACQQVKPIGSSKWLPATRCANGDQCQYSHTILEQMYHPNIYKTSMCMNYTNPSGNRCKWGYYCTHAHGQHDIRPPANRRSNLNVNVNVNVNVNAGSNVNGNSGTAVQSTNGQQIVGGNDVDEEGLTMPLTEIRSPSAEEDAKRTITRDGVVLKDNENNKKKELEPKQQEEEGLELKQGSEEEEGRKSMQTIGQSTTAVVEELDNVAYTKAMKHQSEKAYYFLWQEQPQQRSTLSSTAYEHYYFSNGPQCGPYLTENPHHHTMALHPTHGGNGDETFPFWKNEISPSPTTGLNMGMGMGLGMGSVDASVDMTMLWAERDNEPAFLGHLSRPAVQGGGIGLCDTDSDDEFVGTFPINIPLTSTPLAQQEEPISGEDVLTR